VAKMGRPPPEWFKKIDKLGLEDDVYLSHREIAERLGLDQNNVRITLIRYTAEFKTEIENNRAIKRFCVKSLRKMAKKALADYDGG
jgi:hypothetical protein